MLWWYNNYVSLTRSTRKILWRMYSCKAIKKESSTAQERFHSPLHSFCHRAAGHIWNEPDGETTDQSVKQATLSYIPLSMLAGGKERCLRGHERVLVSITNRQVTKLSPYSMQLLVARDGTCIQYIFPWEKMCGFTSKRKPLAMALVSALTLQRLLSIKHLSVSHGDRWTPQSAFKSVCDYRPLQSCPLDAVNYTLCLFWGGFPEKF